MLIRILWLYRGTKRRTRLRFTISPDTTQKLLGQVFKVNSFNIGMNLGPESGASIAHIHWQIIPRAFKNITVMNTFADLYIVSVPPEETRRRLEEAIAQEDAKKSRKRTTRST